MSLLYQLKATFPNFALASYARQIEDNLKGCETILDVGCGDNSPLSLLSKKYDMTGVDGFKKWLEKSRKKKIHDDYVRLDVRKLPSKFKRKSFDAVIALDVIEHLPKDQGFKFLKDLESIARKVVILNTPNGFIDQHNEENKLDEHLSGWSIKDFKSQGYKVLGVYGFKPLRGEYGRLRIQPRVFWGIVSLLSHYLVAKNHPKYSFSLMAIKKIK